MLECAGDNPFESKAGQIGVCVNGQWTLMPGIRTSGTVRQRTLASGVSIWVIETDEAVYEVQALPEPYRKEGQELLFEAWFRSDLKSALEGALVIELQQVAARPD
jgi:hypothetical protein